MDLVDDLEDFLEEEGEAVALVGGALAAATGIAAAAKAAKKASQKAKLKELGPMGRGATVCPHCRGEHNGFCRAGRRRLVRIACPTCLKAAGVSQKEKLYTLRRVPCAVCGGTGFVPV
jgi:hypothetical protein